MAFTREDRVSLHKKQERIVVGDGAPSVNDLIDGIPVFRKVSGKIVEYIRIGNVLYQSVFGKASIFSDKVGQSDMVDFADDGYLKFDNGLIMQWGQEAVSATTEVITFPIAFPTACLNIVGTVYKSGSTGGLTNALAIHTLPSTTAVTFSTAASPWDTLMWQAIGH